MTFWIDAQLSPTLAVWITNTFGYPCFSVKFLGLRDASDETIFWAARQADAIVITKDNDFVRLLEQHGHPPKVIWLTCGNTSNQRVREILIRHLATTIDLLQNTNLVEITG